LEEELKISGAVSIRDGEIIRNKKVLFRQETPAVDQFLIAAYTNTGVNYPKFYKMDSLARLGWLSAEYLLSDRNISSEYPPEQIGVVLANRNSSLDADQKYYKSLSSIPSPALFVYTLPNIVTGEICIRHKIKGENAFFIQHDFDAPFMNQYVSGLMNNDILQACICGWVDILGNDYQAVLFLIEKHGDGQQFNSANMLTYFQA